MTPQPLTDDLPDVSAAELVLRKIIPDAVGVDAKTEVMIIIPATAFKFDDDLSLHSERIVVSEGSTIAIEYCFPANGAVEVPLKPLLEMGARVKYTPHTDEKYLGPAHVSVFGINLPRPSKTEKTALRDTIMKWCVWRAKPSEAAGAATTSETY